MTSLQKVFDRLLERFGTQNWWPGDSQFEIIVGAILTQNTAWTNAEKAINNLKEEQLLEPSSIRSRSINELAEVIRPAGYYRLKAKRLFNFVNFLFEKYDDNIPWMFETGLETLREELLGINGIGPETADSILLYAGNKPTFVVDAYTARICKRHLWLEPEADYNSIKDHFELQLDRDARLYNEFHALIVKIGKEFCKKKPICDGCPLAFDLPDGGPVDFSA